MFQAAKINLIRINIIFASKRMNNGRRYKLIKTA